MAKSKSSRGKSKAAKGAGRTAPKRARRAAAKAGDGDRVALKKWVSGLTAKQLRKLATLKVIVEDPCTCERIGTPQLGECEWTIKWENSGA